jgi:hypothetical protein
MKTAFWDVAPCRSRVAVTSVYIRAIEVRSRQRQKIFPLASVSRPALGIRGTFPGAKARPGRDADHSPPSSAEVENE